jgi:hypothetical protein
MIGSINALLYMGVLGQSTDSYLGVALISEVYLVLRNGA